jgi:hypothetical protein
MPAIPALDEFVPGYEASGWLGVGAPKNTPIEIIENSTTRSMLRLLMQRQSRDLQTWEWY